MRFKYLAIVVAIFCVGVGCGDDEQTTFNNNKKNDENNTASNNQTQNPSNNNNPQTNTSLNNCTNNCPPATAHIQIINNSPDPAAAMLDIYVEGDAWEYGPLTNDLRFRTASRMIEVFTDVTIMIAPADSTSPDDATQFFRIRVDPNSTNVLVINGLMDPTTFDPNPDGEEIGLSIHAIKNPWNEEKGVAVFHGVPDAPALDLVLNNDPTLKPVDDLKYGSSTPYIALPDGASVMEVTNSDNTVQLGSFDATLPNPVLGYGLPETVVVVASGFLNEAQNENAQFGLYTFPSTGGEGVRLPDASGL